MKYGLELQQNIFTPWRLSYIAYDLLKQELKTRQTHHGWTRRDEDDFIGLLDNELTKVYDFINAKLSEIDARILYCERTINGLQKNTSVSQDINYGLMDETLTEILFDVNDLSKFTRVNFTAIQKIIKKHDKWTHLNLKQDYVQTLRNKPLDKQRFDVAIIYISALHDICRNRGEKPTGNSAAGGDQNAFERATAKYWIHPDNVTEVKAIIMLHLPVLIFDKNKQWEASDSAISSIYFENQNFDLYTGRLQRDEGAEAIRYRWYGSMQSQDIFIERKTHHAPWLDGASVKDRFRLKEPQVNNYSSGKLTADVIANDLRRKGMGPEAVKDVHFIAQGIQTSLKEKGIQPMLRAFYNRTAFQLPGDQRVRVSLDTDLTFIREDQAYAENFQRHRPNWRRTDVGIDYPFSYVPDKDILRFPFAVLETKLQTHLGQEPPAWLTSLLESHLVHEVPRFSKYLHGAAHFYRDRLPLLPWWLSELSVDIRKPRAENTGLTRSRSFKPLIDGRYRRTMIEEKERAQIQNIEVEQDQISNQSDPVTTLLSASSEARTLGRQVSAGSFQKKYNLHHVSVDIPMETGNSEAAKKKGWLNKMSEPYSTLLPVSRQPREESSAPQTSESSGEKPKKQKKIKVEPKVFFANERTFISWLQFSALLLTVALSLLNFGDHISRAVGGALIGLATAVAAYALYRYEKRAWMITNRIEGRYDDIWGPAVLCILLITALIVNLYVRFR